MKINIRKPIFLNSTGRVTSLNKLCDLSDWSEPEFSALAGSIMDNNPSTIIYHRKLWEFTKTVQAFQRFGVWNDRSLLLSVAAGTERLLYYTANHVRKIVATDIYGVGDFSKLEADRKFLADPSQFAPYEYRRDSLEGLYMSVFDLRFCADLFDGAFCMSSIEHFGGVAAAVRAIDEMGKVVRPGGIVVITTECSLNGKRGYDVFLPAQIDRIVKDVNLDLVEGIDWGVSEESLEHLLDMRADDLGVLPHINLKSFGSAFTSISLVFKKPGTDGTNPEQRWSDLSTSLIKLKSEEAPYNSSSIYSDAKRYFTAKARSVWFRGCEALGI